MRFLLRMLVVGLLALQAADASAQWFLRGEFNDWSGNAFPMADQGGGHFTGTVNGLTPGNSYEYKVASEDWTTSYPGSNGKITANAVGKADFHFYNTNSWSDGWQPSNQPRVGYKDPEQYGWELIGTPNDPAWSAGPASYLTDMGNGLHRLVTDLDAGEHAFKFRKQDDVAWSVSIGDNFGNSAANIVQTLAAGTWAFELDLPGGRWRVTQVPEPATAALGGLAMVAMFGVARRRK